MALGAIVAIALISQLAFGIVTKTPAFTLLPERLTVMVPQSLPANHRSLVGSRKAAIWRFMEEEAQGFNINSRSETFLRHRRSALCADS